jgi:hypothetical protein
LNRNLLYPGRTLRLLSPLYILSPVPRKTCAEMPGTCGIFVDSRIVKRTEILSLRQPLYDAATWVRQNVPNNVTIECIAPQPMRFWFFVISHHSPPYGDWLTPPPTNSQWLAQAANGSLLVVMTTAKTAAFSGFVVAFHEGTVFVLRLNDTAGILPNTSSAQ